MKRNTNVINLVDRLTGNQIRAMGTSYVVPIIRQKVLSGEISYIEYVMAEGERLDTIAGRMYGDGKLWWLIAACSNIGFAPQVPSGTQLKIPNLDDISRFV